MGLKGNEVIFNFLRAKSQDQDISNYEPFLQLICQSISSSIVELEDDATNLQLLHLRCLIFYADLLVTAKHLNRVEGVERKEFSKEERRTVLLTAKQLYLQFYQFLFEFNLLTSQVWNQIYNEKLVRLTREERIEFDRLIKIQQQNDFNLLEQCSSTTAPDNEILLEREFLVELLENEMKISYSKYNSIITELTLLEQPLNERTAPPNNSAKLPFAGKPFVILSDRQTEQSKVFGSSHRLPNMTIDEYLELEKKRGGILDYKSNQSTKAQEGRIENDSLYDESEVYNLREFDSFKDENRRGSGNRINYS